MGVWDGWNATSLSLFSSTFLENCGRGEGLRTTTCLELVVVGKHGHALCKIP